MGSAKIIAILIFLHLVSGPANSQMRQVYVDGNEDNDIRKISFYSPSHGYIAFRDWIGFTTDSGRTFTQKYITLTNVDYNGYSVNLTFGFGIEGVKAFNQDSIIVFGDYGLVPSILYSINGGNSFTLVLHSQFNPTQLRTGIRDMVFPENNNTGYAVDADRIWKTIDKGVNWTVAVGSAGSYFDFLEAVNNNTVFAFSKQTTVIRRTSNGTNWTLLNRPAGTVNYVHFISPAKGWINMGNADGGSLYYTSNSGTNWTLKTNNTIQPFLCTKMRFINDSTGYAIMGTPFRTFKTTDSGRIWQQLPRDNNFSYLLYVHEDLFMYNNDQFWSGGGYGFLEMTTNGGGNPLPTALFQVDTVGYHINSNVNLVNFSKPGYQYQWFVNGTSISTTYHASYTHDIYHGTDTVQLVVLDGLNSDTAILYPYFITVPFPLPTVNTYSPLSGGPGTLVTITGNFFDNASAVSFGGIPATSFTVLSRTQITAVVGDGGNGNVSVTTPSGTGYRSGFITYPPPVISSFSPGSGPVGTTVIITGVNFNPSPPENTIYFGAAKATVTNATSTQLTVQVPYGTTYAPVSVTINRHTAYSRLPFSIVFPSNCADENPFAPGEEIASGGGNDIALGDFDGDNKIDLAIIASPRLSIFRNTGSPGVFSFEPRVDFPAATNPKAMAAADLDGDGKTDIVVVNPFHNTFSFFKNNSTSGIISFAPRVDLPTGVSPNSLVITDLDNDGKPDIAVVNEGANVNTISVYRNISLNGIIAFEAKVDHGAGNGPFSIAAGDLNNDGKTELVIVCEFYTGHTVLKNTSEIGVITFAPATFIGNTVGGPTRGALVDMNNDGKLDYVVVNNGQFSNPQTSHEIYKNTTTGESITYGPKQTYYSGSTPKNLAVNDFNGDGKPDVAITFQFNGVIKLFRNTGSASDLSLLETPYYFFFNGANMVAGDLDGDGKPDLASVSATASLYRNQITSAGPFTNTWTGAINNEWENPGNWSCNKVPGINTNVVINSGTVVLNSNATVWTLTINPTATFNVNTGSILTILH